MENDKDPRTDTKKRTKIIVGAVFALAIIAMGAVLFRSLMPVDNTKNAKEYIDTGIVDWSKIITAHPDYKKYEDLKSECAVLELETQDVDDILTVSAPTLDTKPFDDAVWQKNAADIIGARAELERKSKKLAADYRAATKEDYEKRRAAIDGEYLNAILNINVKLDNQAAMHNPLDNKDSIKKEREEWLEERENLKHERGRRQMELANAYEAEVKDYVNSKMAPEIKKWQESLPAKHAEQAADMAAKKSAADKRNADAMAAQLELAQKVQARVTARQTLAQKKSELAALEAHILNDIAGKAAKVAILHHLTLIVVHHPKTLADFAPDFGLTNINSTSSVAIGLKTIDVTDELATEVGTISASE